ncbi:hypothetical protein H4Q26_018152 [Puccinia striiformis f. sp. tritici PST-130]|nr:hypothetical protein H4Q26_018152 [Puccinia striiformis f. sp. tritici PST-130]
MSVGIRPILPDAHSNSHTFTSRLSSQLSMLDYNDLSLMNDISKRYYKTELLRATSFTILGFIIHTKSL